MGIISVEQADHLYWLGRYTERVYTTANLYDVSFDEIIDVSEEIFHNFCQKIDIPDIYVDAEDFLKRYPFDPTIPDSIMSNLLRAYDNAIVLRESIGSETLSYIQLAIYDWQKASANPAPLMEVMKLKDHIMAFWGIADDIIDSEEVRNILKAGKRIERIDLYARLGMDRKMILREVYRMIPRVEKSGLKYEPERLTRILELARAESIDYYRLVSEVEAIF